MTERGLARRLQAIRCRRFFSVEVRYMQPFGRTRGWAVVGRPAETERPWVLLATGPKLRRVLREARVFAAGNWDEYGRTLEGG